MADNTGAFGGISCVYCQEEIDNVRIQCCECPNFDICLQCFALGAEIGPHKNSHAYKFVEDSIAVNLFGGRGAWLGIEHLRLLDAAELHSYGNWDLIAQHVKTRTADECKEEYIARYLDGNIGKTTWNNLQRPTLYTDLIDEDTLVILLCARLKPVNITPEEAKMLGYRPLRNDFEGEYDSAAERLVSELQSGDPEETGMEKALKLAIVDMYIRKLRERQRRKRIISDYKLVSKYFENLRRESPETYHRKGEKELRNRMRTISQFITPENQEELINSIYRERELRHRVAKLKRYRNIGLLNKEEIIYYEQYMAMYKQLIRQKRVGNGEFNVSPVQSPLSSCTFTSENGILDTSSTSMEERTTWPFKNDSGYESGTGGQTLIAGASSSTVLWKTPKANGEKVVIDISDLPFTRMLNLGEINLCICLNLRPVTYLTLKSLLIQDSKENPNKYKYIAKRDPNMEIFNVKEEVIRFMYNYGMIGSSSSD